MKKMACAVAPEERERSPYLILFFFFKDPHKLGQKF